MKNYLLVAWNFVLIICAFELLFDGIMFPYAFITLFAAVMVLYLMYTDDDGDNFKWS